MIIISTKYTERLILKDCLFRISMYFPDEKVVIVDSDSENLDFLKSVDVFDVIYNNSNYDTGAYYKAFLKYPNETTYMFIHDSLMINSWFDFSVIDLIPIRHFKIRYDSTTNFTLNVCSKIGIKYDENCFGCFGPMFLCNNENANKIFKFINYDILPTNKIEAMSYERIFGLLFNHIEKPIRHSFQGEHVIDPYGPFDETVFTKIYLNRQ